MKIKVLIGAALGLSVGSMWLVMRFSGQMESSPILATAVSTQYGWLLRLIANCLGYATVLMPMFLVYTYLKKTNYFDKPVKPTCWHRCLFACFGDPGERLPDGARRASGASVVIEKGNGAQLAYCLSGLVGAYLVWGLLQEKIMTQNYMMSDSSVVKFHDSQFLVFINRLAAFLTALTYLLWTRRELYAAPLYQVSYCSLTNILSAWCQYEALKYVSYPTQVLSKSCKVIPVMLMGRVVSGNRYELYEYVTASMISVGMLLFTLGANDHISTSTVTTVSGLLLLALYLACDSFTSSWQGELFHRHHPTPLQMMLAVNLISCSLTAVALPITTTSLDLLQNPVFLVDCILLSASSTVGQLFIYYTIANFGAVIFTIIMTIRQALSILLSCIVYGHEVSVGGVIGIILVFAAVMLRVYCRQRLRRVQPGL